MPFSWESPGEALCYSNSSAIIYGLKAAPLCRYLYIHWRGGRVRGEDGIFIGYIYVCNPCLSLSCWGRILALALLIWLCTYFRLFYTPYQLYIDFNLSTRPTLPVGARSGPLPTTSTNQQTLPLHSPLFHCCCICSFRCRALTLLNIKQVQEDSGKALA